MLTDNKILEIRSRFRIFQHKIYLNSCSQGALSDAVQTGLDDYIASWHEQGSPWETWVDHYEAARAAFAQFINASPDEVAIVTSASAGINSIASALSFRERNTVVMGEFEFPTMGHVWLAQRARGADVQFVSAEGNRIPAVNYEKMIDRNTLIVPLTHVCFKNGFRSEVDAVTQMAHQAGALVMLDDYQDCGTRPVDVKAMDLDFYVTGTLKYLLGPPGLAFMYVRKDLISTLQPTVTGWFAQTNPFAFDPQHIDLSPTARRFESGSPSVPNVYAAMPGFQLLQEIGMENVATYIRKLTQSLLNFALDMGIRVKTPSDSAGPLVVLQSCDANLLVQKLAESDIVASNRHDGLRIAFHVYNTMDDVNAVMEVLRKNVNLLVREPAGVGSND
ncbi:MAG TPA: aminotransferase class V-fold PLP-dependent enzyme [Candidatus Polarisedimenticolia bacterium]|jgi:selenocysteine lyase/cysteine desulfurase|nr:aminotransferase class V-fold PLP-dependent enzyme [Candidatus Polarisedimenticolia bacterium]